MRRFAYSSAPMFALPSNHQHQCPKENLLSERGLSTNWILFSSFQPSSQEALSQDYSFIGCQVPGELLTAHCRPWHSILQCLSLSCEGAPGPSPYQHLTTLPWLHSSENTPLWCSIPVCSMDNDATYPGRGGFYFSVNHSAQKKNMHLCSIPQASQIVKTNTNYNYFTRCCCHWEATTNLLRALHEREISFAPPHSNCILSPWMKTHDLLMLTMLSS